MTTAGDRTRPSRVPRLRRPGPASLTTRLVVTAVTLVIVVSVLIGAATTLAMRARLTHQLDEEVRAVAARLVDQPRGRPRSGSPFDSRNLAPRTLVGIVGPAGGAATRAWVLGEAPGDASQLDDEATAELADVPVDGTVRHVDLHDLPDYRVVATEVGGAVVIAGLPTRSVDEAVASLLGYEALLVLLGGLLAATGGVLVVRRQLRPLTEVAATAHAVAALPLDSGEVDLDGRVPVHLRDERTEVGRVGSALATLLDQVGAALAARHRSEQQVRQFVADASHELRTPLTTIAGYAELARRRPDDAEAARTALSKVELESARMTALVEDLLLLARLDAGRPLEREPVDVTRLLLEAVSDARVVAPAHRWRLELPDEAVEVVGDEQRLHQVVTNLLTNARRYTPTGSTVTVRAERREGRVAVAVHDDGPGFPPELVDHAFERFARGDAARTGGSGVGLGLSLVRAIVTAHAGSVRLDSRPGDTTVAIVLPAVSASPDGTS